MRLRIEGHTLPGRHCGPGPDFPGVSGIEVAVQRKDRPAELLDPQPGDALTATWTLTCTFTADGELRGPYVHNRLGGRFVYLSWVGSLPGEEGTRMFRRAKLMLADVPSGVLADARRHGVLVGRLALTDAKGNPVCGRVVPPAVEWTAGEPSVA
ncbi:monooxygenase [Streptacidiphilus sp. 4-A2]|nr:monooxygenase [Streptacidiphilus sp. 4-A2]